MNFRKAAMLFALSFVGACTDAVSTAPRQDPNATARLRVIQGTSSEGVDVLVDNKLVLSGVALGQASSLASLTPGTHTINVRRSGSTSVAGTQSITVATQDTATIILIDSSTVINPIVLTDTGATPAAGKSKMRVVHFATNAPAIDVWRTQPDYSTLIRVMFPFAYRAASSYLESDSGDWNIVVTPEGQTTQLYTTGAFNIPAGQVRTVVLVDAPGGGIKAVIVNN